MVGLEVALNPKYSSNKPVWCVAPVEVSDAMGWVWQRKLCEALGDSSIAEGFEQMPETLAIPALCCVVCIAALTAVNLAGDRPDEAIDLEKPLLRPQNACVWCG